jgi:hypothetical protein
MTFTLSADCAAALQHQYHTQGVLPWHSSYQTTVMLLLLHPAPLSLTSSKRLVCSSPRRLPTPLLAMEPEHRQGRGQGPRSLPLGWQVWKGPELQVVSRTPASGAPAIATTCHQPLLQEGHPWHHPHLSWPARDRRAMWT